MSSSQVDSNYSGIKHEKSGKEFLRSNGIGLHDNIAYLQVPTTSNGVTFLDVGFVQTVEVKKPPVAFRVLVLSSQRQ